MTISPDDLKRLHQMVDTWASSLTGAAPAFATTTGPRAGLTLKFEDRFDYIGDPDWTKWDSQFWYSPTAGSGCSLPGNSEIQWYVNHKGPLAGAIHPWHVDGTCLTLRAEKLPASLVPTIGYDQDGARTMGAYRYSSGLLRAKSFSQAFGYWEVECKMPAGRGLWPAFWLLPTSHEWPPELDIFEMLGHEPNRLYTTQHPPGNTPTDHIEAWGTWTDWHKIGMLWTPNALTLYVDDQPAGGGVIPCKVTQPMYPILNLAVGGAGSWPGAPAADTVFPADFKIRSVRVWG